MEVRRLIVRDCLGVVVCAVHLATAQQLLATNFTWTRPNGCGIFSCDFFNASYWSPDSGPPGTGDMATINMTGGVHLTQNTGTLDNLTLNTSTSFRNFGHRLTVTGSPGNLFMFGSGFQGSTTMRVDPGGGFQIVVDTISLHQGSELFLAGGDVLARFRMLVSRSSLVSGNGTLGLTADGIGGAIELAGTMRPSGGNIAIVSSGSTHDLDGNIAGVEPGFLDLTSTGSLFVNGEQADPFSGRLDIGNGRELNLNSRWDMDGDLTFTTMGNNRLVGPSFNFLSGAQVTTNQSTGRIEGESLWLSGASLQLTDTADSLVLAGDSQFASSVTIGGDGQLVNSAGFSMALMDGTTVGSELFNQGILAVGGSAGGATFGEFVQDASGTLAIELGGTGAGKFDALHVLGDGQFAGNLNVTLLGGFSLAANQQFKIIEVDGAASGQFAGLAEGDTVGTPGEPLFISYAGGDGNDVVLYTAGLPGDFNFDGKVNGADFLKWQRGGSPNPLSASDLADWEANYGAPTNPIQAVQVAVPEPATLVTLLLAMLIWCGCRGDANESLSLTYRRDASRCLS